MGNSNFPQELSFYIIGKRIFYNTNGDGIPHIDLWRKIVSKIFSHLDFESRQELMEYPYGIERGRIVFFEGIWRLYGTPGCKPIQTDLESFFQLGPIPHQVDFEQDRHYKVIGVDRSAVQHALKLSKVTEPSNLEYIHLD